MINIDSIIFDLDGTLWNSSSSCINAWNENLKKYPEVKNKLTASDMQSVMGLVLKDVAKTFFPYIDEEKRLEICLDCRKSESAYLCKHGGVLYENLEYTLKELSKKYKLFIVSNCQKEYIESFFTYHKLKKYFSDYECSGRTNLTKGENINLIIKRNHLSSSIYVGDTEGDLKASRFAKIPFVLADYGFGQVNEYDYIINKFTDLLKL